jgi:predicted RNase H-like HicB family nuclease
VTRRSSLITYHKEEANRLRPEASILEIKVEEPQMEFLEKRAKELRLSKEELAKLYIQRAIDAERENRTEQVFEVVLEREEDGRYYIHCPTLKGCRTWGHTEAEALGYMQEAMELYLQDLIADGKPVPGIGIVRDIKPVIKVREITTAENRA